MKNPKKTLLIGFIVGLLFFGWWFRGFLYINWRFGLFSWDSWAFLFHEIGAGWRFSNKGDWIFLISFILSFPLYLGLWYWADHIQWGSLFKKATRTGQKIKKLRPRPQPISQPTSEEHPKSRVQKAPPITAQRPIAMPSFGPTMRTKPIQKMPDFQSDMPFMQQPKSDYTSATPEKKQESFIQSPENNTPSWDLDSDLRQVAQMPLSDIQLPQTQSVDEDIDTILKNSGWTILSGDSKSDWLAVSQEQIVLASYDDETGDWLADEEAFNDEDPLWFSETDHRTSPVFNLGIQAKNLNQKLTSAGLSLKVQPLLIERKGNLINAEDMLKTWNDLGVIVCRTATGGPVQLKTVSEVFNQSVTPIQEADLEKIKQILS